jgi:hypothetical protein
MGAARYTADKRSGAMHGKSFLLDAVYAGIDENNVYGRLDFLDRVPHLELDLIVNIESWAQQEQRPRRALRLDAALENRKLISWKIGVPGETPLASSTPVTHSDLKLVLARNFEFKLPLSWLWAIPPSGEGLGEGKIAGPVATKLKLRFSLWQNGLPVDALPLEGWIELELKSEAELAAMA